MLVSKRLTNISTKTIILLNEDKKDYYRGGN